MSCYFRHLQGVLDEADITVTPANKKQIDEAFHKIVGTVYKDCPATWKEIKQTFLSSPEKRAELARKMQAAVGQANA